MMRGLKGVVVGGILSLLVAGCVTTQEMPLAPNVVRIDTKASGHLFTDDAVPETMRAAAKATLSRGFTHFRFEDATMNQGSEVVGVMANHNKGMFRSASVVRAPTANVGGTVVMFKAEDPRAKEAFDAKTVLDQYPED